MRRLLYFMVIFSGLFSLATGASGGARTDWERGEAGAVVHPRQWGDIGQASPAGDPLRAGHAVIILAQAQQAGSRPGTPTPLTLPEEAMTTSGVRFIMIRGLPSGFVLSQGFPVKQTWFLSMAEAKSLQIISPPGFAGDVPLEILCFKDSKEPPLSSFMRTYTVKPEGPAITATGPDNTAPTTASLAPALRPLRKTLTAERENDTLKRGEDMMKRGDIAGARLLFEDLAGLGSARGAFAMAQSYDPDYLRKIFIQGTLQPDVGQARTWYENAARLGSGDAQRALGALASGPR